ncbi:MAG: hypothetical protein ACJ71E_05660 [Nitrososphaeraceae archaeon]
MNHITTLMLAIVTILVGISASDTFVATFVQKTNAVYEGCKNSASNSNNTITCTGLSQRYKHVTLAYLLEGNTDSKLNHNDTATSRNMYIYPYSNMPFILPFP